MRALPVGEMANLNDEKWRIAEVSASDKNASRVELLDNVNERCRLNFAFGETKSVIFSIRTVPMRIDVEKNTLTCGDVTAPIRIVNQKLTLEVLIDRGSMELLANDGEEAISLGVNMMTEGEHWVELAATGGQVDVTIEWQSLLSIWK